MSEKSGSIAKRVKLGEPTSHGVDQQIRDFLSGRTDGADLLDALYGDTLHEQLPPRLTDLLASWHSA